MEGEIHGEGFGDPAEARDLAVAALEYMQDTSNDDGAIVDCFVDLEPDCLEP